MSFLSNFRSKVNKVRHIAVSNIEFARGYQQFRALSKLNPRFPSSSWSLTPYINDKTATTAFDRHYVYHPAWAARVLTKTRPTLHIDIGSTLHFCSIISAFIPTRFYDYRPAQLDLSNLRSDFLDLLSISFDNDSIQSLSCMHTVEHIGLGRYGDSIDPDGDLRAMRELMRVLAPKGNLLFVAPIGKPRIKFNAHRIYSFLQVRSYFSELELKEFTLVPDDPKYGLIYDCDEDFANQQNYGCGCFWFSKK